MLTGCVLPTVSWRQTPHKVEEEMGSGHTGRSWSAPDTLGKLSPKGLTRVCFHPRPHPRPSSAPSPISRLILQVQDGHTTSYPSLLSHLTSTYLNTPVLSLPVAKRQLPGPGLRSFHPLASSLPCDFHLLNLRTLQGEVSALLPCAPPGPDSGLFLIQTPPASSPRPRPRPRCCLAAREHRPPCVCHPGRCLALNRNRTPLTPQGFRLRP